MRTAGVEEGDFERRVDIEKGSKYFYNELDLGQDSSSKKIEKPIKDFFQKLLKLSITDKKMILKIEYPANVTTQYILDVLNKYGVYGIGGCLDKQQEWRFSFPSQSDKDTAKVISQDDTEFSNMMHDLGAKGRRVYRSSMLGVKVCYFVGNLINLREEYINS